MPDKYTTLFGVDASFVQGEQPTHTKLTNIVALTRNGLTELEKVTGMIRDSLVVERTGNSSWVPIPAKDSYNTGISIQLKLDFPSHIVSIARAIGPMSGLNPRYLSNQTWLKDDLGSGAVGILLKAGVTEQQLPFKPFDVSNITPADFSGPSVGLIFQTRVTSYEPSLEVGKYYVTPEGRLFTGAPVKTGTRLKYSFRIGEGDGYIGSGYNVIPDPSILTFSFLERDDKTIEVSDFGACRVLTSSITEEALVVDILLPEVISTPFSKLTRSHAVEDSDPVGKIDRGLPDIRRYSLPDYYPNSGILEENTLYLYYTEIGKVIPEAKFERVSEFLIRAYLPPRYKTIVRSDDGELFNVVGISNSKHFFLITNGTQLAPLVGKLRLEMEEHSHNGLDSVRVSHNDLADVNHILPWRSSQLNIYGNVAGVIPDKNIVLSGLLLNTSRWFNRKLSKGEFFEENPHPYYLHRLGYLGGGTDGLYASINGRQLGASLGNGLTGDLVLMPVTGAENTDEGGYTWESTDGIDYTTNNSASHSLWFGLPWEINTLNLDEGIAQRQRNGSVRMYFDPWIRVMGFTSGSSTLQEPFSTEGLGVLNTGTIGADVFSNEVFQNAIKGLNIQRGNFFFGYNENKFLSTTERDKGKSSFNILASEFNAVVTANKKADQSPEGRWKGKSGNRAGFVAKAIEGASINFSIGGLTGTPGEPLNSASLTSRLILGENYKTAGSFTVEGAFGNQLIGNSPGESHGAGVLVSPGMGIRKLFSWQVENAGDLSEENVTYYAGWKRYESIQPNFYTSSAQNLGGVNHIFSTLNEDLIEGWLLFKKDVNLTESVKNKNSFPFGKVIIEGGSGIDLLVSRRNYNSIIQNVLDFSEVRFWGREDLKSDIENDLRDSFAAGANINLMYGYGKSYRRFGTNLTWTGSDFDIKGEKQPNTESLNGGINPWTSLRNEGYQAVTNKDARGSQIRQASFVEAMEGFRSDPNQPFTVTYRLPFRVIQRLTWMSEGYTTKGEYTVTAPGGFSEVVFVTGYGATSDERSFIFIPSAIIGSLPIHKSMVIAEMETPITSSYVINPAINVSTWGNQPSLDIGRFEPGLEGDGRFTDEIGYSIFVDQIIRYYDYQDWAISGYQGPLVPGQSLVDFSVNLNYSKLVHGDSGSELFGQKFTIGSPTGPGHVDLDDLYKKTSPEADDLAAYISSKHSSTINGCFSGLVDDGLTIRAQGSTSGLADVDTTAGIDSWVSSSTYEPYKASLMIGRVNLNEDEDYRSYDSIGYNRWLEYITNIKNSVDSSSSRDADYWGEGGEFPLGSESGVLAWYLQLEGEPKREAYSLHRFAPYELFLSSNGKEYGYGPSEELIMAFDGYINLTFKTRGGSEVPRSGKISQTGVIT